MGRCDNLADCALFNHRMANMPMVADALKRRFCWGDWDRCARFLVHERALPVPHDLYPEDVDRAARIVDGRPEQWCTDVLVDGDTPVGNAPSRPAATQTQRVGIGFSELDAAAPAGRQAARAAVAQLGAVHSALAIVYASVRYDLTELLCGIREITGETPLIGASSSGHFGSGRLIEHGRGVAVLLLGTGRYRFGVASVGGLHTDPFATGYALAQAARSALGEPSPHAALLALPCGLNVDHQRFIDGIYRVAGAAVPVVGGVASDDRHMRQTFVFHNDEILLDGAVGVWIGSNRPLRIVTGHGWQPRGLPLEITGVDGPLVRTIAGRPALEVFQQNLTDALSSNDLGAGDQPFHPPVESVLRLAEAGRCLGIIEPDGSRMLRGVFAEESGAVRTWVPLPPFAAVQIMTCTQDELLDVCDEVGAAASADREAGVLLAFSCVARLRMLRDRGPEEARRLQRSAGRMPIFGFYSYGELGRSTSSSGVHNAAITGLTL